jgi:hypothetical protein
MALNRLGDESLIHNRPPAPVTLPALESLKVPLVDDGAERREVAAKFLEARIIKTGVECWQAIGRAESFEAWVKIGKALQIGRDHALKTTGANRPEGRRYCAEFSQWIERHGFAEMQKSVRSVSIELVEHLAEIESWRATLPEKQRKRLVHPLSVTRRWRAATGHGNVRSPQDLKREAAAAWRRFVGCLERLPATESAMLWQAAQEQAAAVLSAT